MKKTAPFLILGAGLLWGSMGLFVRSLDSRHFTSMEIVALRAIVTTLVLFLYFLFFKKSCLKIRLCDLWCFLGTGICSIVFFNYCYFMAMTFTSLSTAAVLLYTAPVIVMVLSFFLFHEKLSKRKVVALFMTFAGCVLVTGILGDGSVLSPAGLLYGLGAGLGYALYSIFSRFALERGYHSLTITFYTFFIAALGTIFFIHPAALYQKATAGVPTLLLILALGICTTVVPYLLYTFGLQYVENGKAAIIASVEPVAATLFGILIYHETISLLGLLGICLVLAALIICGR